MSPDPATGALAPALVVALPLAAALVGLLGRRLPGGPAGPAVAGTGAATVLALLVLAGTRADTLTEHATRLTPTGGIPIAVGTRVDPLAAVTAAMVCLVALLVQLYSVGYLRGDPRYPAYAAEVSLFTAAMLTVVLAADLFQLLVGWEVMGLCSYLLIGHYRDSPPAGAAAVKAFFTTRVGDVGFLFGIFVLGTGAGSFRIADVLGRPLPHGTVVLGTLLLLCGVVGKSAQFPLHTWLPDAMAGPTPISALIHAATMVAAGVYVVARLFPLFLASPATLDVLAVLAAVTMVLGALAALAQDDLKRVLAYSTISQLAYMTGGLAVGGYAAGLFHLLTHAAFKALLFLCAGAVIRTVGTNLMSEMGGLRAALPVTFATTTVGLAALVGVPPFAGFFSKDAVLTAAHSHGGLSGGLVLGAGLVTVVLTAAYAARLWLRTFFGGYAGRAVLQEPPWSMRLPLLVLAVPATLLGLLALPAAAGWLGAGPEAGGAAGEGAGVAGAADLLRPHWGTGLGTVALALLGAGVTVLLWRRHPSRDPVAVLPAAARRSLAAAFHLDGVYDAVVVRPALRLARGVLRVDEVGVDGVGDGTAGAARALGGAVRRGQDGNLQRYASGLLAGVVLLAVAAAVLT